MSLKEQAQAVLNTTSLIQDKNYEIQNLCMKVLDETKLNGEVIGFSDAQNQKIIQYARTLITELKALVEALP